MRRRNPDVVPLTIETHPLYKDVADGLRITNAEIEIVKPFMPNPEIMDAPLHGWTHILHMLVYATHLRQYSSFDENIVKYAILLHDVGRETDHVSEDDHAFRATGVMQELYDKTDLLASITDEKIWRIVWFHNGIGVAKYPEEAVVRGCDRMDLWRLDGFLGCDPILMEIAGWRKVEKIARKLRGGI